MSRSSDDTTRLAAATAARLRLLQGDLAEENGTARRTHLDEVLEQALGRLRPDQREPFLDELERLFPSWDRNVEVSETLGAPTAPKSATDEKELKDPAFLVARLAALAPALNEVQKRVVTDRLREAGLAPAGGGGPRWPDELAEKVRARLGIKSGDLDGARILELMAVLAELAASLDQLVWNTWRTVSPRSALRRPAPLAQSLGKFVAGDGEVGRAQVAQDVERLRQLTAALVSAISQVGRQFAQQHVYVFGVEAIKGAAGPGSMMKPQAVRCWEKYVELAGGRDETAIETEITQAVAAYAETLMKGVERK